MAGVPRGIRGASLQLRSSPAASVRLVRYCSKAAGNEEHPSALYRPCHLPDTSSVLSSALWSPSLDYPVLLPADKPPGPGYRAERLLRSLETRGDQIVDIELGSYDDIPSREFERIPMPLGSYLQWLRETSDGTVGGRPLYLAQWVGREKVDAIGAKVPPLLQPLLEDGSVDLYMQATFLGPTGAVSPFHCDAYMNLFHLQASSDRSRFAKHVLLMPPRTADVLRDTPRGSSILSNTSRMKVRLRRAHADSRAQFHVEAHPTVPARTAQALAAHAQSCVLREGETLFIPRGWWHRVENVCLADGPQPRAGWTAGVSWWFLPRSGVLARPGPVVSRSGSCISRYLPLDHAIAVYGMHVSFGRLPSLARVQQGACTTTLTAACLDRFCSWLK